jgi:hypothetical protein
LQKGKVFTAGRPRIGRRLELDDLASGPRFVQCHHELLRQHGQDRVSLTGSEHDRQAARRDGVAAAACGEADCNEQE